MDGDFSQHTGGCPLPSSGSDIDGWYHFITESSGLQEASRAKASLSRSPCPRGNGNAVRVERRFLSAAEIDQNKSAHRSPSQPKRRVRCCHSVQSQTAPKATCQKEAAVLYSGPAGFAGPFLHTKGALLRSQLRRPQDLPLSARRTDLLHGSFTAANLALWESIPTTICISLWLADPRS